MVIYEDTDRAVNLNQETWDDFSLCHPQCDKPRSFPEYNFSPLFKWGRIIVSSNHRIVVR